MIGVVQYRIQIDRNGTNKRNVDAHLGDGQIPVSAQHVPKKLLDVSRPDEGAAKGCVRLDAVDGYGRLAFFQRDDADCLLGVRGLDRSANGDRRSRSVAIVEEHGVTRHYRDAVASLGAAFAVVAIRNVAVNRYVGLAVVNVNGTDASVDVANVDRKVACGELYVACVYRNGVSRNVGLIARSVNDVYDANLLGLYVAGRDVRRYWD